MGIDQKLFWLGLHKALSPHPALLHMVGIACESDVTRLAEFTGAELDELFGEDATKIESALARVEEATNDWEELKEKGVQVVPITDARYPEKLREMPSSPPIIYVLGNLSFSNQRAISICGSRHVSEEGLEFAKSFGSLAAELNLVVVSGFASGVDTAAHLGALGSNGRTIIVLAEGISNFRLKKPFNTLGDFYDRAVVISEFYPKNIWQVSRAMTRNRTICGLSEALVVVEAGARGGTLAAGRECIEQRKPLLVVERSTPGKTAPGNRTLINEGGIALHESRELKSALSDISMGLELNHRDRIGRPDNLESLSNVAVERQLAFKESKPQDSESTY